MSSIAVAIHTTHRTAAASASSESPRPMTSSLRMKIEAIAWPPRWPNTSITGLTRARSVSGIGRNSSSLPVWWTE